MQQQDNKIFKTIIREFYEYFIGTPESEPTPEIDRQIQRLEGLTIGIEEEEIMSKPDEDYINVFNNIVEKIKEQGIEIKKEFLSEIIIDFWMDIAPTYVTPNSDKE